MEERLTHASRRVLAAAESEAAALGHASVSSEHLLLALLAMPLGTAGWAFAESGWGPDRLRATFRAALGNRPLGTPLRGLRSLDFLQALELAQAQADQRGHHFIDPDHLLLGALAESTGASDLLSQLGITRANLVAAVERRMWEGVE